MAKNKDIPTDLADETVVLTAIYFHFCYPNAPEGHYAIGSARLTDEQDLGRLVPSGVAYMLIPAEQIATITDQDTLMAYIGSLNWSQPHGYGSHIE